MCKICRRILLILFEMKKHTYTRKTSNLQLLRHVKVAYSLWEANQWAAFLGIILCSQWFDFYYVTCARLRPSLDILFNDAMHLIYIYIYVEGQRSGLFNDVQGNFTNMHFRVSFQYFGMVIALLIHKSNFRHGNIYCIQNISVCTQCTILSVIFFAF